MNLFRATIDTRHPNSNETVDTNLTTELICDFLDHIGVRTYVTDFHQKSAIEIRSAID